MAGAGLAAAGVIGMRTGGAAQGASEAPLTAVDVRTAVERFAAAVAEEDDAALSRVLAPGVKRVFPTDAQRGRRTVLAAYRSQFAAGRVEAYEVTGLEAEGGEAGRATGRYRLEVAGRRPVTGEIVFGVVRDRGRPRIGLVAATPD